MNLIPQRGQGESMERSVVLLMSWLLLGCLALAGCSSVQPAAPPPAGSYRAQDFDVRVGGTVERIKGAAVSDTFFSTGRAVPMLGRTILPSENGSMRVAVISYRFWNDKFHSDPAVIGKTLQVNERNVTIVGVMAKGFAVPDGAELWAPLNLR
jgi:hypothetical protein